MADDYLYRFDPNEPPHMADSTDVAIEPIENPADWPPPIATFIDWAGEQLTDGLVPMSAPIDGLSRHLGHIHKLAVVDDGADFEYRIYGEKIMGEANVNLQSRTVSLLIEPARSAFLGHYRELMAAPRLFVGRVRYGGLIRRHPIWLRAVAPAGTDGTVEGFFVMTYPEDDAAPG